MRSGDADFYAFARTALPQLASAFLVLKAEYDKAATKLEDALSFKGRRDIQRQREDAGRNEAFILGFEAEQIKDLEAKLNVARETLKILKAGGDSIARKALDRVLAEIGE